MECNVSSQKQWSNYGPPDSDVYDQLENRAQTGDLFFDSENVDLYFCIQGAPEEQIWFKIVDSQP